MNMAEPPTSGWTIVLPSLEDGLEPELEQTKLPPLLSALSPSFQPPPTTTTAAVAADIDIETNERPSYTHHRSRYGAYECQAAVVYHYRCCYRNVDRCLSVWDHLHRQRLPFAAAAVAATPLGTSLRRMYRGEDPVQSPSASRERERQRSKVRDGLAEKEGVMRGT